MTRETRDHHRLEIHRPRPFVGFRRVMLESLRLCSWRLSCRWERRSAPGPSVWVLPPLAHPLVWCSALGPFLVLVLPLPATLVRGCEPVSPEMLVRLDRGTGSGCVFPRSLRRGPIWDR